MFLELGKAQDALAVTISKLIPEPWERIVISFEMNDEKDGTLSASMLGFYIVQTDTGEYDDRELAFSMELQDAFMELNRACLAANKQYFGTCEFVLDSNGKYNIEYSYDPPKRMNGIINEESYYRFGKKYLENYIKERKGT